MTKSDVSRTVIRFVLIGFLFSWPILFGVDAWLEPMFSQQDNVSAARLSVLFGHTLAMLGPAIAALFLWRFFHRESPPAWTWSRPKYYAWAVLAMLAMWTLPGVIGLFFGDTVVSPIGTYIWIAIAAMLAFGWISGMGEETGWCAYLLPQLAPGIGRTRALIVSGVIRGLWHWPVVISPIIGQVVAGERTPLELLGAGIVIAFQLVVGNIFFGAVMGWIWYRTESIPLVGWTHFWHNLTRDVTIMLLAGYGGGLWAAGLSGFVPIILGAVLLDRVIKSEGLNWWQLFDRGKGQKPGSPAEERDSGSGTRLRLSRGSAVSDKLQAYKILIDGSEVGEIRDGQTAYLPVSPGSHTVQLRMDWCRSNPVEFGVGEGEVVRLECGSSLQGWRIVLAVLYLTFLRNRYMWIRRLD
jgi:membrane protease YdiL (CAAX protease family)